MMHHQLTASRGPYIASITREPFLFYEMRVAARLLSKGITDEEAVEQIIRDNLFQYPTEKSIKGMARACVKRLRNLEDDAIIAAIAQQPHDVSQQLCLYAMMKQYRLVSDFMMTVIGEKYRQQDFAFSKMDLNVFFLRLQEQDDGVAAWSDTTITKIKQILVRTLVDTEYLDGVKADHINTVFASHLLKNALRANGDQAMLPAFNCFE